MVQPVSFPPVVCLLPIPLVGHSLPETRAQGNSAVTPGLQQSREGQGWVWGSRNNQCEPGSGLSMFKHASEQTSERKQTADYLHTYDQLIVYDTKKLNSTEANFYNVQQTESLCNVSPISKNPLISMKNLVDQLAKQHEPIICKRENAQMKTVWSHQCVRNTC